MTTSNSINVNAGEQSAGLLGLDSGLMGMLLQMWQARVGRHGNMESFYRYCNIANAEADRPDWSRRGCPDYAVTLRIHRLLVQEII
jgi:hypothetical protein